jgi:1,4-alpha-glucan branching enzyme
MGGEFGQWREWNEKVSLDWHLLEEPAHKGVQDLLRAVNKLYLRKAALWESDSEPAGFEWIEVDNAPQNVISFRRIAPSTGQEIVCVCNFSPLVIAGYRVGLPRAGNYKQLLNTDAEVYGGGGIGVVKSVKAESVPSHGLDYSAEITLPPLATMWFQAPRFSADRGMLGRSG